MAERVSHTMVHKARRPRLAVDEPQDEWGVQTFSSQKLRMGTNTSGAAAAAAAAAAPAAAARRTYSPSDIAPGEVSHGLAPTTFPLTMFERVGVGRASQNILSQCLIKPDRASRRRNGPRARVTVYRDFTLFSPSIYH